MRNRTASSQASTRVALSLGILAMALGGPALAADGKDAGRGGKRAMVTSRPGHATLPVSPRSGVDEKGPAESVGAPASASRWNDALVRLASMLREGIRF
jgi:hypothetical protein